MHAKIITLVMFIILGAGCATNPNSSQALECENGLKIANQELEDANSKGFSGAVEITKATSLLGAAAIQKEFGKYPNCIDKVTRARAFIKASQR